MKQFIWISELGGANTASADIERPPSISIHDDTGSYTMQIHSVYFTCPWCGETWAAITLNEDNQSTDEIEHTVLPISCRICNRVDYRSPVPGSILHNGLTYALGWHIVADPELIYYLPEDLVRREFLLTLKAFPC